MKKVFPAKQGATTLAKITLVDATGAAIPASAVSSLLLTYWNAEQTPAAIINTRTAQNVKNANNGTLGATDGLFTWALQALDTAIVDQARAIGDTELHAFRLDCVHSLSGSPFSEVYGVRVECQRLGASATPARLRTTPTIALATVMDVLNMEGLESYRASPSLEIQEWIAQGILATSHEFEQATGRRFQKSTAAIPWTDVLDRECGQRVVQLPAYPVASIVAIKSAPDGDFASATALAATDYALVDGGRYGQVKFRSTAALYEGPQTLQVTYVGGLAQDVHHVPADLKLACLETVRLVMKRPENIDISGKAQSGGSVTYFRNAPLPKSAEAAIDRYRSHGG